MCGRLSGPFLQKGQRRTSERELLKRVPVVQAKFRVLMQRAEKCGEWALERRERTMLIWIREMLASKCLLAHLEALLWTSSPRGVGCTML